MQNTTTPGKIVTWGRPIYSWKDRSDFRKLGEHFRRMGIIEPSKSLWLNPTTFARKKDGSLRFCLVFRRVNNIVELDEFELPNIQTTVRSLYGQKYFSVIDLKDGYFQVPLDEKDREKTAFLDADNKLMQFTKLIQGFKNSPEIFHRGMQIVLEGLIGTCCYVQLDGLLVFGKDDKEHDDNLEKVDKRLRKYNLEANKEKVILKQTKVDFLGYTISKNCITSTEKRTQGILSYERPKTLKKLREFLGAIGYDRMFIENLSSIAKPLYAASSGETRRLKWTAEF